MKIGILIIGLIVGLPAGAQDSLSYYLKLAAGNNPAVLQKYYEYEAVLQKMPQVGSLPDPELSMGVFLSPMELIGGNQIADLRLMQMFPWFGTLREAKDEMGQIANAKYESFRDQKLQLFYEVQSTYYDLYKVQQNIIISEKYIGILASIERLALAGFRSATVNDGNASPKPSSQNMSGNAMSASSGGTSLTDLYRLQIEAGDLVNDIALQKNLQNSLIARFNGYLNRQAMNPVSLPDSLYADTLFVPLEAVSDSMLVNNPMLAMLHYEQKSLESRKKMVSKMGYPMIGLGLNYSVINKNEMSASSMNGKDMVMPMVTVTLPIYRNKYKAMGTEVNLLREASLQNYSTSANNLKTTYYQAVQLYQDAKRRVVLYADQALLANKSLELMMKRFAVSDAGLTDLLRLQQQALMYDVKKAEAVADVNTAIAWLNRLMASPELQ